MGRKLWLIATGLLVCAGVILLRSNMVSFLYPAPYVKVGPAPRGFNEVSIQWKSGETAAGWFCSPESGSETPALLYFHGNGENLQTMHESGMLQKLRNLNTPVLALDYPGYGRSSGKPTEAHLVAAADAAARWMQERFTKSGWVVSGWSLGAAVATQCASRNPQHLKGVIVMSAWSSLHEVGAFHYPAWLTRALLKERYDSVAAATSISQPVLAIHGELDDLIPLKLGEKLSRSFASVRWVPLPNTGHNDLLSHPRVQQEMAAFLKERK